MVSRTGRDLAAVGPDRGPDRARVGRAAGRAPGQAHLQRAALGQPPGRGDGAGEGHPVRAAHRGRPRRSATPASTRRPRASCSSSTPWSRGTGRPTTGSSTRTGELLDEVRSWSGGPGGAASSSTTRRCSTSTTSASRPSDVSARHFDSLVEEGPRGRRRSCYLLPPSWSPGRRRTDQPADYPRPVGRRSRCRTSSRPGTADDGVTADIPLAPLNQVDAEGFAWQVPGLRAGAGHRADPDPAQARCGVNFVPAPDTPGRCWPRSGTRRRRPARAR